MIEYFDGNNLVVRLMGMVGVKPKCDVYIMRECTRVTNLSSQRYVLHRYAYFDSHHCSLLLFAVTTYGLCKDRISGGFGCDRFCSNN